MVDLAKVGISVDTSQVKRAKTAVKGLKDEVKGLGPATKGSGEKAATGFLAWSRSVDAAAEKTRKAGEEAKKAGDKAKAAGAKAKKAGDDAAAGAARGTRAFQQMQRGVDRLGRVAVVARAAIVSLAGAAAIGQMARYSDTMASVHGQLRLVTNSTQQLADVQEKLFDVAQETRVGFQAVVELYAKTARFSGNLGLTQDQLLKTTKATNQAVLLSGANAATAAAGVMQFTQALASGRLQGDELRSILENIPGLAQAIATGLGVTVGELRKLGSEGKLQSKQIIDALLSQADRIDQEFQKLPRTIGQAATQLNNELLLLFGDSEFAEPVIEGIDAIREALNDPEVRAGLADLVQAIGVLVGAALEFAASIGNVLGPVILELADNNEILLA